MRAGLLKVEKRRVADACGGERFDVGGALALLVAELPARDGTGGEQGLPQPHVKRLREDPVDEAHELYGPQLHCVVRGQPVLGRQHDDTVAQPAEAPRRLPQAVEGVGERLNELVADFIRTGPTEDEVHRAATSDLAQTIRGLEQVGGFGGKASLYPEEALVCLLSRRLGRPVKWLSDRLEDLLTTTQAFDEIVEAELACDEGGHILGLRADCLGDVGAYSVYPWTAAMEPVQVVSFLPGPYRVSNYRARARAVATSKAPTGAYRGVGRPISAFVMERLMDMAAAKLGLDPLEMRRRNMVRADEFPYKSASGIVWDKCGFMECLESVTADYDALRRQQAAARAEGRWVGLGLASYAELTGLGSRIAVAPGMPVNTGTETATIRIDSTGAVTAHFGIASHGQGLETTLAQVIAEELGVRVEDVEVIHGSTQGLAHGTGTFASRSSVLAGGAAIITARAVREQVLKAAAHMFEADSGDLDAAGGEIFVTGTDRSMTFRQLAKALYSEMGRFPKVLREQIELQATRMYDPYFGTTSPASHLAMVEVDPETYGVTILHYGVADDCGRVINPLIVDGQVHGGVAQGIGAALMEEVVHDGAGQILTASLMDYVLPTAVEIPSMSVHHVEEFLPDNVGGFRGMGEGGTIGAPAALANAISDAVGEDINVLPMTPERLYRLLNR